jgi:Tol biopolymer transport system component
MVLRPAATDPQAHRQIRGELAAICASRPFLKSKTATRLLVYLVEQELAGRGLELREVVVGREIFALGPDYDPMLDSIVRVNANRLRVRLEDYYYANPPVEVKITLRKGSYIPIYSWVEKPPEPITAYSEADSPDMISYAGPDIGAISFHVAGDRARTAWPSVFLVAFLVGAGFLATLHFLYRRPPVAEYSAMTSIRPFGDSGQIQEFAQFSPDGQTVALVSVPRGSDLHAIYLEGTASDNARRITQDKQDESRPSWSPDGKQLAYLRLEPENRKQVVVRTLSTNAETVIANIEGGHLWLCNIPRLSWSPDARRIYTSASATPGSPCGLISIDVQSHAIQSVLPPPQGISGDLEATISPDGRFLAFIRNYGYLCSDVLIKTLDGGALRQVSHDCTDILGLTWNKEGTSLIVASSRLDGERRLWSMPVDGAMPVAMTDGSNAPSFPSLDPRHGRIVFTQFRLESSIWRAGQNSLTEVIPNGAANLLPKVSPDGNHLLFTSNRSGRSQLWISNIHGENAHRLIQGDLYSSANGAWSPDGTQILFECHQASSNICLTDMKGSKTLVLTHGLDSQTQPSWSHDGKNIYFTSNKSGITKVYRQPIGSAVSQVVTPEGGENGKESADGRWLYFGRQISRYDDAQWLMREPIAVDGKAMPDAIRIVDQPLFHWQLAKNDIFFVAKTTSETPELVRYVPNGNGTQTLYPLKGYSEASAPDFYFDNFGQSTFYAKGTYKVDLYILESEPFTQKEIAQRE